MTREEAINRVEDHMEAHHIGEYPHIKLKEALDMALTALRPVSREWIEKAWRGEWMFKPFYKGTSRGVIECQKCKGAFEGSVEFNFCPNCGAPMTDEAMQMVVRRLERLYDN